MTHVLIVDDIEESSYLLKSLLEGNGYRVSMAGDGLEALAAARREPPDIIVSDALMPKMDGFALCRAWMQEDRFSAIPFVFYSATYTSPEDEKLALALGAVRYLIKPLESEVFLRELTRVLREWAARPAPGPAAPLDEPAFRTLYTSALSRKIESKLAQLQAMNTRLRQSEHNYRQLFEDNPQPMMVYDLETLRYLAVNDAAIAHYGYSRDEFLAMTLADIRSAEEIPRLMESVAAVVREGTAESGIWRHRKKDGTPIDVEISTHIINFGGRRANMVLAQDVTKRLRAERDLHEREQRFRATFEQAAVGMAHVATDGRWLRVNQKLCDMVGYTRDELGARSFQEITHPDDLGRDLDYLRRLLATEIASYSIEKRYLRKDGEIVWINLTVALVRKDSGEPDYFISVIEDINARKRGETELIESEERFRGLVEQSIAGICIIQDNRLTYVNPRFAEIGGYASADEVIGLDAISLVAANDRGTVAEHSRRLLGGETRSTNLSFSALRKDGSSVEVGVHGTRATYKGRPAIIGLMQDISEKKRAEEKIQQYIEQLKSSLMSTVEVATTLSELRDPYTAGHERHVAQISVAIGAELGFDESRLEGLRVAGSLHDVGKITIPAEILSKPGKLSRIEYQLIQGHAQSGYEVLKNVEFPWPVAEVALQHHERMDGSGYPQGLKGEAILLDARILAVADVVEAMASHRPYREARGIEAALAEIERGRGSAYDPLVADACLKLFREKGYALPA